MVWAPEPTWNLMTSAPGLRLASRMARRSEPEPTAALSPVLRTRKVDIRARPSRSSSWRRVRRAVAGRDEVLERFHHRDSDNNFTSAPPKRETEQSLALAARTGQRQVLAGKQ